MENKKINCKFFLFPDLEIDARVRMGYNRVEIERFRWARSRVAGQKEAILC